MHLDELESSYHLCEVEVGACVGASVLFFVGVGIAFIIDVLPFVIPVFVLPCLGVRVSINVLIFVPIITFRLVCLHGLTGQFQHFKSNINF